MTDYTQTTDFSAKDSLATGDPEKVILGSDVDAELGAISTAIASKANSATTPTLAGNTFTSTQIVSAAAPKYRLSESDQASNEKIWEIEVTSADLIIGTKTDAAGAGVELLKGVRGTGTAISSVELLGQVIDGGEYTPTLTNVSGVDSTTLADAFYLRIGTIIVVFVQFALDTTSSALARVGISLPVASNIGAVSDVIGMGLTVNGPAPGAMLGDVSNNRAEFQVLAGSGTSATANVIFAYKVI